jgi:hypothetical protein
VKPLLLCLAVGVVLAGCGLSVQSADLFLLKRSGAGGHLTLLVSDDGTVRCNGGSAKPLSDKLLIQARDLTTKLNDDAKRGMHIPSTAHSVATYTARLQHGTISFPDTAARAHSELAQLELFAVQAAQVPCGLHG